MLHLMSLLNIAVHFPCYADDILHYAVRQWRITASDAYDENKQVAVGKKNPMEKKAQTQLLCFSFRSNTYFMAGK